MESDVPHNQTGGTETDPGGQILPFPREWAGPDGARDWLGPCDELVPFGPRARVNKAAASDEERRPTDEEDVTRAAAPPQALVTKERPTASPPRVQAQDFWSGLADAGDLIQFPADHTGTDGSLVRHRRPGLLVLAAAALCSVVVMVRIWTESPGGSTQAGASLAQAALSIMNLPLNGVVVDQQQIRHVAVRVPPVTTTHRRTERKAGHLAKPTTRVMVSQSRPASSPHSQPVVYSAPTTQSAAAQPSSSAAPASSSSSAPDSGGGGGGGGAGGHGGGSGGGGSRRSGPTGPGATFGPGKMGG